MDGMRAGDADRERVAAALREEMAVGRITLEEFEERLSRAYDAKTWDDLRALTSDLPVDITFDGEVGSPRPMPEPAPAAPGAPEVPPGAPMARRGLRFSPLLFIPLIALGIGVAHGAIGALIPMALILWFVFGAGIHRSRRRYHHGMR